MNSVKWIWWWVLKLVFLHLQKQIRCLWHVKEALASCLAAAPFQFSTALLINNRAHIQRNQQRENAFLSVPKVLWLHNTHLFEVLNTRHFHLWLLWLWSSRTAPIPKSCSYTWLVSTQPLRVYASSFWSHKYVTHTHRFSYR